LEEGRNFWNIITSVRHDGIKISQASPGTTISARENSVFDTWSLPKLGRTVRVPGSRDG